MTDILLIAPPFSYGTVDEAGPICPHLGITSIAAVLKENDYEVKILDAFALKLNRDHIEKIIKKVSPKIIGVTAVTAEFPIAKDICNITKKIDKDITTIIGGPHVTIMPKSANSEYIDYLVLGEGDYSTLELMNYVIKGKGEKEKINGIAFKENRKIKFTKQRTLIENLDELPFPAYDLLPMNRYRAYAIYDVGRKFVSMITSRGCPFKCIYCTSSAVFGHILRQRSPEKVIEEIRMLNEKYNISHIYFQDDEFTINHKRIEKFCDLLIQSKMDIFWECLSRVDHIDSYLLAKMAKAGCKGIAYGAECGYQEGLTRIKKGTTVLQLKEAIKNTKKFGIQARASFMMGFPWEGKKEIKQTIKFAKELDADVTYFQVLIPYPGTEIYEEIKKKNLIVKNDWNQYIQHPIIGSKPIIKTEYLTNEQLKNLNNMAFLEMYTNPKFLIKKILKMKNFTHLKRNIIAGIELITNAIKKV